MSIDVDNRVKSHDPLLHRYVLRFVLATLLSLAIFDQKSNMQGRIDINPFFSLHKICGFA